MFLLLQKNLHYGFDFCPGFWDWIIHAHQNGKVFSIDKVQDEINIAEDELKRWAKKVDSKFFLRPDENIFPALEKISNWTNSRNYDSAAVEMFLRSTDCYLVAQAMMADLLVVTHEIPSISLKKIKIPNVCIGLQIKFVTPFEMLRRERVRFILEKSKA